MSDKKIVIKGKFIGYYSIDKPIKGTYDTFKIKWDKIIIESPKKIDDYNVNELKIGNYQYVGDLTNEKFKILSPDKTLISQEILKFVILKNIHILKAINDDGKKYFKAEGDFYGKLPFTPTLEIKKLNLKSQDNTKIVTENLTESEPVTVRQLEESKGCFKGKKNTIISNQPKEEKIITGTDSNSTDINGKSNNEGCGKKYTPAPTSRLGKASNWFKNSKVNKLNNNYFQSRGGQRGTGCNRRSSNGGCLTFILFFLGLSFLVSSFDTSPLISAIILGLFGLFLILASFIPRLRGSVGSIIGMLFLLYVMGSALSYISNFINEDWWQQDWVEQKSDEEKEWEKQREREEVESKDTDSTGKDGPITYFQHNHNWKENSGNKRNSKFRVRKNYFQIAKNKRNSIQPNTSNSSVYWNKIYSSMVQSDRGKLTEICQMYDKIGKEQNLNYNQFADMVVTSIQWIPYVLVLEKSCEDSKYDGGFVTEYLLSGKPCLGNIKFGIQSPVEFMSNFKGDCDTRSVLCFMILDQFGYDVAVLVSEQYGHAILGINLNSGGGDYVKHKGKRYYVWETTATGFEVGNIPPACSNLRYWKPALTNN